MHYPVKYCKTRKYVALQILAPLAHVPLSAKIDSVPMIYF